MKQEEKDSGWFRKIFDENYNYIRNFIYYLSGDTEITNDLTQDVFLLLWEDRNKIRQETIRPFLFTVAKNLYLKHYRKKKISFNFTNSLITTGYENESPEFILEMKEFDGKLQASIALVPVKTRAIFLMNRMDRMSYNEIAVSLKISTKAVEKHMSKALKILREKVDRKL